MFDVSVADQSVTYAEAVHLNNRAKEGVVGQVIGSLSDNAGINSSSIRGDIGYTFKKFDFGGFGVKPGVLVFGKYDQCDGKDPVGKFGASGIVDFGKIKFLGNANACFEVTGSRSSDNSSEIYSGLSLRWRW